MRDPSTVGPFASPLGALDLASLLSGSILFWLEVVVLRFSPSRLILRTVQVLCAPFLCQTLKEGLSICPVETVRLILQGRGRLRLTHNAIFFSWMHLRVLLDAAAFIRCILYCLFQAGIQATYGSTRLVTAAAALARDAPLGDVPCLGEWGATPQLISNFSRPSRYSWKA
jgi:hypothetical protein